MKGEGICSLSTYGIIKHSSALNLIQTWEGCKNQDLTINYLLQVLYLYDYYRTHMAWVSSCSMGVATSILVIYANYVLVWCTIDGIESKSETLCPFS